MSLPPGELLLELFGREVNCGYTDFPKQINKGRERETSDLGRLR